MLASPAAALASTIARPPVVAGGGAAGSRAEIFFHNEMSSAFRLTRALFVVDAVTSLAGSPIKVDDWEIDAIYSGSQKCLSCPPGLAPASFSERALNVVLNRKTKVQSWYLDVNLLSSYWGQERVYHHTAPINMNYALHEALQAFALFDVVANNTDRKSGHILIDSNDRLWGIDHGVCFSADFKLRTVVWEFAGQPIPAHLVAAATSVADAPPLTVAAVSQQFDTPA